MLLRRVQQPVAIAAKPAGNASATRESGVAKPAGGAAKPAGAASATRESGAAKPAGGAAKPAGAASATRESGAAKPVVGLGSAVFEQTWDLSDLERLMAWRKTVTPKLNTAIKQGTKDGCVETVLNGLEEAICHTEVPSHLAWGRSPEKPAMKGKPIVRSDSS